jgi:hypothetical protein
MILTLVPNVETDLGKENQKIRPAQPEEREKFNIANAFDEYSQRIRPLIHDSTSPHAPHGTHSRAVQSPRCVQLCSAILILRCLFDRVRNTVRIRPRLLRSNIPWPWGRRLDRHRHHRH